MGVTTNGQICFGILLEEGAELPWDDAEVQEWWRKVRGFKNPHEDPFDGAGDYKPGFSYKDPRITTYYDAQAAWDKTNPAPVELVNCCSGDYPIWIIAHPGTVTTANRGFPTALSENALVLPPASAEVLAAFCTQYGIEFEGEARWYLSSYWG